MENLSLINATLAAGSSAPKAEIPQQQTNTQQIVPAQKGSETNIDARDQEKARFEAVKRAAQQIKADAYPVSDVRFTIYKETTDTGEAIFVTRFTSLRDGKITVVPEPQLLANVGKGSGVILETLV